MHTSPLLQPGSGDAGGMNVFLDQLSRTMAARGVASTSITRLQDVNDPRIVEVVEGYRVIQVPAGPPHPLADLDPSAIRSRVRRRGNRRAQG